MVGEQSPKMLLVEGPEDRYVFASLCNVLFGERQISVRDVGGKNVLKSRVKLANFIEDERLKSLGIVTDGDYSDDAPGQPENKWDSFRPTFESFQYQGLPERLPPEGLIVSPPDKLAEVRPNLGLWILPNNHGPGYLETLLMSCIHEDQAFPNFDQLRTLMESEIAKSIMRFRGRDFDKAFFRTWLAWSQKPDLKTGDAIKRYFYPRHDESALLPLVVWLKKLFRSSG